jgi:hypothetical protein
MPQWDHPHCPPYSVYQCERPHDQAEGLIKCRLREPLKSPDHIRLLKLYPPRWPDRRADKVTRKGDDKIRCDVFKVTLASVTTPKRPYFATLSYVWGNSSDTRTIKCGKKLVPVTTTLHGALDHIRNLKTPRLLWVDTLCINQADKREKGQQVQRMHLIYGQSHCISWMGVETEDQEHLQWILPIMRRLSEAEEHLFQRGLLPEWNEVNDYLQHNPVHGLSNLHLVPWATILKCLDCGIFARLWCVQEIVLARSNDVRTSRSHIDVAVLARSSRVIYNVLNYLVQTQTTDQVQEMTGLSPENNRRLWSISRDIHATLITVPLPCLTFKKETRPIEPVTALSVVSNHYSQDCSDPRDHVYGLAALCNLGTSYHIDYSASPTMTNEVYADFTLHCIRTTRSLLAFRSSIRRTAFRAGSQMLKDPSMGHRPWTIGLPSWCPDFAGPTLELRLMSVAETNRNLPFSASKGCGAELTMSSRQKLGLLGIEVGTVQRCGTVWKGAGEETSSVTWQYIASLKECMGSLEFLLSPQALCRLLLDVLSLGQNWRHCPAWAVVANILPAQTGHRMIQSSLGAG